MNNIVLDAKTGIVVPITQELKPGIEVVRVRDGVLYTPKQFGEFSEDLGVIVSIKTTTPDTLEGPTVKTRVALVTFSGGINHNEFLTHLVAYSDVQKWLLSQGKNETRQPLYKVDQVVFLRPIKGQRGSEEYPSLTSPYERDVKITGIDVSRFGSVVQYTVYIPGIGYRAHREEDLITAKEKERVLYSDFKEFFFTEDMLPFFTRGERVKAFGGYIYNSDETVMVPLTTELNKYLSWSIKQK